MMRYLVIDRSTSRPGMALFEGNGLAFEEVWDGEPARAPQWMAEVRDALTRHGVAPASLSAFVCGLGPGSFSGIRGCLAALHGLALPGGKPVYGVASAAAIAFAHANGAETVTVVGDARRGRLWCVTYRVGPGDSVVRLYRGARPAHTADDFRLVPAEELASAVPAGTRVVSPDWLRLEAVLRASFDAGRLLQQAAYPSAAALGALALADPEARVLEPLPIYLHPAVAEGAGCGL